MNGEGAGFEGHPNRVSQRQTSSEADPSVSIPAVAPHTSHESFLPKRIGRYCIKRVIASGGMGTVYEATQDEPRRTIALKVMKLGIASRSALRRFEYESQTLARLNHPNIAQIYEAGTHRDEFGIVPYFAMEYIPDARPITQFAADKQLGTRDRMRLFAQVCETVHHGHQKGVIHRDLKPSNILVGADEQVKVIDFGVARGTDPSVTTSQTSVGELVGTLQYMSPEQSEPGPHDIDTRSDVYALGVVFYELLTGQLPYDVQRVAMYEATRLIRERQATKPGRLNRKLRGDVEAIVLKALEKERERRYQSAADFARDIEAYLDNEPIAAHPPSRIYQFRTLVRRNKAAFGSLAALFALLVSGATLSTSQYLQAESARQEAEISRVAAESGRSASEKSRDDAGSVVRFLSDMLASIGAGAKDREVTVRAILDEAAETVGEKFTNRPLIEADLRHVIGLSYYSLGHYGVAELHHTAAAAIRRRELGAQHPQTLSSINHLANSLRVQGKFATSGDMLRENYEITRRVRGEEHTDTLRSMRSLAAALGAQGQHAEAEELLRKALDIQRRDLGEEHPETLRTMNSLAVGLRLQGRNAEAEQLQRRTIDIRRRVLGEQHPETLRSMNILAAALDEQGRHEEAEKLKRKTLAGRRHVLGAEHPETLQSMNSLAVAFYEQGRPAEAERLYRETLESQQRILGETHPQTLQSVNNLAVALSDQGRYAEAEALYRKTLNIQRRVLSDEHPDTLPLMTNLGVVIERQGRYEEAEALFRETLEVARRVVGKDHIHTLATMHNLAETLSLSGEFDEAEALFRATLAAVRRVLGNRHPTVASPLIGLAEVLLKMDEPHAACVLMDEALEIRLGALSHSHPEVAIARSAKADCLTVLGRYAEAEPLALLGYERLKAANGAAGRETIRALARIVQLYEAWGKHSEAAPYAALLATFDDSKSGRDDMRN